MKKYHLHHLWLIFCAYGVWFAIFSGLEEVLHGKYWKALLSLLLGIFTYIIIETKLEKKSLPKLIVSILGCQLVGLISVPFTFSAIPTWYATLVKPSFSPPNWLFGPVWTLLYLLMGLSFYLIWRQGWTTQKARTARNFFLAQLALNFLWSFLFFGLRSPFLGLLDILALLALITCTLRHFYPLSKPAFYLLLPYLLWVSFATLLNLSLVILN